MVADVVVENASYSFDIPFSYPGARKDGRTDSTRVQGAGPIWTLNRSSRVWCCNLQLHRSPSSSSPSRCCWTKKPLLGKNSCGCWSLLHQRTFCTYYEGLRALVPSGLTFRLKLMFHWEKQDRSNRPTSKRQLLDYLSAKKKPVELEHLLEQLELERGEADFEQLLEEGAILLTEQATEKKIADSKEGHGAQKKRGL